VQKLALKTRKGKQRQIEAQEKRKGKPSAILNNQREADSYQSIPPKEKKNYKEAFIDYTKRRGYVFTVNFFGDENSDPNEGHGEYLVVNSRDDFDEGFKDFIFEKPSEAEVNAEKDKFIERKWKGRIFSDISPKQSLVNGFTIPAYIHKDDFERWKKSKAFRHWEDDRIDMPEISKRSQPVPQGKFSTPSSTSSRHQRKKAEASAPPTDQANFSDGKDCTCQPFPLKRRRRPLKRRRQFISQG
jgi:hypothetical protein